MDLQVEWKARRCRRLLNLIDRLPAHSHYAEMISQDEEHAERLLKGGFGEEAKEWRPALRTWTPESAMLASVIDELRQQTYAIAVGNGAKGLKPPVQYPRPSTAIDRVRPRIRQEKHKALVARVLPHKQQA